MRKRVIIKMRNPISGIITWEVEEGAKFMYITRNEEDAMVVPKDIYQHYMQIRQDLDDVWFNYKIIKYWSKIERKNIQRIVTKINKAQKKMHKKRSSNIRKDKQRLLKEIKREAVRELLAYRNSNGKYNRWVAISKKEIR